MPKSTSKTKRDLADRSNTQHFKKMKRTSGCRRMRKLTNPPCRKQLHKQTKLSKRTIQDSGNWPKANNKLRIVYLWETLEVQVRIARLSGILSGHENHQLHCRRGLTLLRVVGKTCANHELGTFSSPSLGLRSQVRWATDQRMSQKFNREILKVRDYKGCDKPSMHPCLTWLFKHAWTWGAHWKLKTMADLKTAWTLNASPNPHTYPPTEGWSPSV